MFYGALHVYQTIATGRFYNIPYCCPPKELTGKAIAQIIALKDTAHQTKEINYLVRMAKSIV